MNDSSGTRVVRTGIALVHEGEYVVPAMGTEAVFASSEEDGVHYHFPVEIDVRRQSVVEGSDDATISLDALSTHLGL